MVPVAELNSGTLTTQIDRAKELCRSSSSLGDQRRAECGGGGVDSGVLLRKKKTNNEIIQEPMEVKTSSCYPSLGH
jgi:hypothetical protein